MSSPNTEPEAAAAEATEVADTTEVEEAVADTTEAAALVESTAAEVVSEGTVVPVVPVVAVALTEVLLVEATGPAEAAAAAAAPGSTNLVPCQTMAPTIASGFGVCAGLRRLC